MIVDVVGDWAVGHRIRPGLSDKDPQSQLFFRLSDLRGDGGCMRGRVDDRAPQKPGLAGIRGQAARIDRVSNGVQSGQPGNYYY